MGPSHWAFLREAHRVLRPDGELRVTEVKSRFDDAKGGVAGFADRKPDAAKLAKVGFAFRACLYKKR
ncbi:hypothetical protein JL720_15080 [Aureococcus anophagefferens]|nr:hypothetical protein JL720_15080 [Aureococcus anophagefferens]